MTNKKVKTARLVPTAPPRAHTPVGFFPFARYTSIVGLHTTCLAFNALFLPQTSTWMEPWLPTSLLPVKTTSLDRPQHPFVEKITANPLATLAYIIVGVAILQAWWGGWVKNWFIEFHLEGTDDEKKLEKNRMRGKHWEGLRNAWIATFVGSVGLHGVAILFGAPIASQAAHTYALALLVSLLAVFTPTYVLGIPSRDSSTDALIKWLTWTRLFGELSIRTPVERAMVYPSVGTLLGCWTGVLPIALDWDRPWQAWPLTPAFGAVGGFVGGSLAALTVSGVHFLAEEHIKAEQEAREKDQAGKPGVTFVPVTEE